mgnify:CR=1 FL=1
MSESVLAILCHLLKGESIINEKLAKESGKTEEVSHKQVPQTSEASTAGTQPSAAAAVVVVPAVAEGAAEGTQAAPRRTELEEQGINVDHLQQLIDMGFNRDFALDALTQTNTLEQATDYLLSHPASSHRQATVSKIK